MERILVIDDDPGFRDLLETILSGAGYEIDVGTSIADARRLGSARQYNLVLSDLRLPDGSGLEIVRWFGEQMPEAPVIVITAFGTIDSAVEAVKLRARGGRGGPLDAQPGAVPAVIVARDRAPGDR